MLGDFTDVEYNPIYEIVDYEGTYPIVPMNKVRNFLINNLKRDSKSKIEFEIKRKCAIFTHDIMDFVLHDKKPEDFIENTVLERKKYDPSQNPFIHKTLNIDEDDLIPSEDRLTFENILANQISNGNSLREEGEIDSPSSGFSYFSNSQDDILRLNKDLNLSHGCDKTCLRDLPSKDQLENNENLVYVCDFCQKPSESKEIMEKHLTDENHRSASEYIFESSGLTITSISQDYLISKIKFVKQRIAVKNPNKPQGYSKFDVFCPKCHLHYEQNVLATSLHFKLCHSSTQQDEVYSIGEFDRCEFFKIDKNHVCFTCNARFKKLSDITYHYSNTGHFPGNRKNEINLFLCPIESCGFKSTKYFTFRNHIIGHAYFNSQNDAHKTRTLDIKVAIFKAPTKYLHSTKNNLKTTLDLRNELDAVEFLLKKGFEDTLTLAKLKEKKVNLKKLLA